MGRKMDLSGLTDSEAEHVLQVVQRDMRLRKKEEERLSELKQELDEEGSRCRLLSRQSCFNQRCCIRCCSPFTFLLNPKRQCRDCRYNVCKACRVYNKRDKAWLCSACQKSRLLKTQSSEWFYTNVKKRFKRFGSAKVLKTLYRKHLAEHSALSELTEGSAYEESICNEGSVCGSDSTFYRQTEEHSMAETLTVALRVAEEAIDEAISKAEFDAASQEKQNEALYLREHRGELIEELAKIIVQKIISRRKTLAEMRAEYDQDWDLRHDTDHHHHPHSACDQACSSHKQQSGLWRSHSASSLLDNEPLGLKEDSSQTFKKEGCGSTASTWKSVDRLDNAGVSSVLKSPDGNWIALQSSQLSRPSLLTKRKSLVYSALERESGVVSAYEGMDSDNETKPEPDSSWGSVLLEIHRKMTDSNFTPQDPQSRIPLPLMGRRGSRDHVYSDSEGNWKSNKPLIAVFKRNFPAEIRRPSSRRTSIIDVNFNAEGAGEEQQSSVATEPEVGKVRRMWKKRRSKKERPAASCVSDLAKKDNQSQHTSDDLTSGATTPESFDLENDIIGHGANQMEEELALKLQALTGRVSDSIDPQEELAGYDGQRVERSRGSEDRDERLKEIDKARAEDQEEEERGLGDVDDEDMKCRLYSLVAQSTLTYLSSTDDELDKVGQSEGEWEGDKDEDMEDNKEQEEKTEGLTYKLCQLEQVRATQFSSTEEELDRAAVNERREAKDDENEGLAVKVCRLAKQVNATQFSSTEDELDKAGRGAEGEEVIDEATLWNLQAETAVQIAQLRDLASLVSASQFSSTEDELDRAGEREPEEITEGAIKGIVDVDRESLGDLDVKMFNLRDEPEETTNENSDEKAEIILDSQIIKDGQEDKTEVEEPERTAVTEDERTAAEEHVCDDKSKSKAKGMEEGKLRKLEERTKEIVASNETRLKLENEPAAKWLDINEGVRQGEQRFSSESRGKWEAAADSNEEEFDRIISSMLMMTLQDVQVETIKDGVAENERTSRELEDGQTRREIKVCAESGFGEKAVDVRNIDTSEETGSAKEFQSQGDTRPKPAVKENPGETVTEETERDISRKKEGETATSKNENEQGERDTRSHLSNLTKENLLTVRETLGTNEAEQMCRRIETDDEEREDGRKAMETLGVTAEGECKGKETDKKPDEAKRNADDLGRSSTSSRQEELLSPEEIQNRYSAVSLRSITTEVLKVLNATEELLQGVEGGDKAQLSTTTLPPNSDPKKLDEQFSRLEENVYMAAGSVYSLEAELSDLEECARGICSSTSDMELSFLEEQVASASAKVQQSEIQICDISARIAALKSAGLNVDTHSRFTKTRTIPVMPATLNSSRQLRRRLPAPPVKDEKKT
ncbi:rab effector MyRIP isoform X2 [Mastacembelus armatus]|uniref:rab effector MyRIP isoform X2 n=1 Tax=Mastacembelus armatus TaxID=205130 RepID=UPI000E455C8A|nr:rab effector MyRIP-like isoform X2 [Mastacembelus armatus]